MYIGAGLGPGPRDGLMTGFARRSGWSLRLVRTIIEASVLLLGWALGGTVGVVTFAYLVTIGPMAHVFVPLFTRAGVTGNWTRAPCRPATRARGSSYRHERRRARDRRCELPAPCGLALEQGGLALTDADAHRREAVAAAAAAQLVEQRRDQARAAQPSGWPSAIAPPLTFTRSSGRARARG